MIIINLKGRLGNQLFQWAAARFVAENLQSEIVVCSGESNRKAGITPSLMGFNLPTRVAQPKDFRKVFFPFRKFSKQLQQVMPHLRAYGGKQIQSIEELEKARQNAKAPHLFLNGYFMSSHIAERVRDKLLIDLTIPELSQARQRFLGVVEAPNSVALHIRRGDFLENSTREAYGLCSIEYYLRALSYLEGKLGPLKPVVFSDDIAWCKEALSHVERVTFFDVPSDGKDVEDLVLMSRCAHQVIANSTYSWWAAYLNTSPSKLVVAPSPWHAKNDHRNTLFLPKGWHKIHKYADPVLSSAS
ncbi:Glycosyl transferase family 11 [Pseudovibrio axinellae]|uniref:Glycosyl transferase family 11 n=1 Tax=Pseudovibrio axinellae TaxID=989403 RepID=A0A165YEU8_9HYPH|nr:alpha-1,2-fucosyltransferase [Pseudovibrio axinellae]KZL18782.1 Glycosyl transferase family 11 [Pseudovibrio axinellae]SEP92988.1 Glycosyl transferase family 11 [Pseudovibrio axinellae]